MNLDELSEWLASRTSGGIRWGLDTTRELLASVDDPQDGFHAIHVGGTNGKGSVAALCDSALRIAAPSRRIGLYTSPHLISFAERIRIDGQPAPDEWIVAAAERLLPAIERAGATFFEATTAIAFLCFAEAGTDRVVVEVGLGGRLDATNVILPVATAVTNVALEHTEYLGDSLDGIAVEKAGIFKARIPALSGEPDPGVAAILRARAEEVGAPFAALDDLAALHHLETDLSGTRLALTSRRWGERRLAIPLPGIHQGRNALLAAELLGILPDDLRPPWQAIERGFATTHWPGRLQVETLQGTTWIFDVAHNPAGVDVLVTALDSLDPPAPLVLVLGVLADKAWRDMLPPLLRRADAAILTIPPTAPASRRWDPRAAADWAADSLGVSPLVVPDFAAALDRAATLAPHGAILVSGSVHTVGDALALLAPGRV